MENIYSGLYIKCGFGAGRKNPAFSLGVGQTGEGVSYTIIIPARYNSSRFPGKSLHSVAGVPLILRAHNTVSNQKPVVATDDKRVFDVINSNGGRAILTSARHESGTDRVAEAALMLRLGPDDIIVNVQGDQPFIPETLPPLLAATLKLHPEYSIATPIVQKPLTDQELLDNNLVKAAICSDYRSIGYFYRRVEKEMCPLNIFSRLKKHVGVYAYRNSFLQEFAAMDQTANECFYKLEQLRAIDNGYKICAVPVDEDIHDVNTPEDLKIVECWLREKCQG